VPGSLTVATAAQALSEIQRTPGGVAIVRSEEYRNSTPAATIKDILDYVPGVIAQPKWGDDTRLSIRGSGLSRNFHLRGVQLYLDGIPINTADGYGDFQEIDPTAYRYVEVYKGANALRYGAASLGGAINFVTPSGRDGRGPIVDSRSADRPALLDGGTAEEAGQADLRRNQVRPRRLHRRDARQARGPRAHPGKLCGRRQGQARFPACRPFGAVRRPDGGAEVLRAGGFMKVALVALEGIVQSWIDHRQSEALNQWPRMSSRMQTARACG
jgi:hypothetical protein